MNLESYVRPAGLEEALAALAEPGVRPLVVAGGTDLVPAMRKARLNGTLPNGDGPRVLLDLSKLDDLCGIRQAGGMLEIGAATTMAAIAAHPLVTHFVPTLAAAAASVGSPLVRNRATLGGNLVTASPSADSAPALLAADAVVRLAGAEGARELPLTEFFVAYRTTALEPGEIVTHVLVPLAGRPVAARFEKVGLRNADAISVVCAACEIELDGAICRAARIGLGAVAPVPVRALAVEAALRGREITEDVAAACAHLVHEHIAPIDDVRASARYRGWVAEAVVARMITATAREARG
jgi:aerobic carbon-monoxide dehydrogenase medium subunit